MENKQENLAKRMGDGGRETLENGLQARQAPNVYGSHGTEIGAVLDAEI